MNAMAHPFFTIHQLGSSHGGPFDLSIEQGECIAIVGRSGAGKSVLLRLLADLDPGTGHVHLRGRSCDSWTGPEWRRRVLYQAAEPAWWAIKVSDHIPPQEHATATALMDRLALAPRLFDADVARLSTGERQRFALVRSLSRQPEVLLLDEPSASLDTESTALMEAVLHDAMGTGLSILMVTHSREQAARMSGRIFEMADRKLRPL